MSSTPRPAQGQLHAVHVLSTAAGAHVCSLASGLVARGVDVTVCGPASVGADYGFAAAGARFAPVELGRSAASDAPAVAALRSLCAGAGVVHAHGLRAALLAALALGGRRVPLVVSWHGAEPPADGRAGLMARWLERRAVRAATVVLGVSSDLVDRARGHGARDVRLAPAAVPRPLPRPPRPPADGELRKRQVRAELGAEDRPLLLAVGRLEASKGYDLLLSASAHWADSELRPLLVIAGEGEERAALEHRIDLEKLPAVLLGRRDDVPELLSAADLVVLPSLWEGRALIAQEALHAGVPLVATAVGGTPELVGEAALLVPYGDPYVFARAVTELLAEPERRVALAVAGRAQAATWPTEDDTVAQVLSVYDELI
ncbi:Glycosyltransferase involved in cell wall bisynthesis [Actinacidiphila yanglinensis]|uniref:Glycosyltransferase involved in cell wall bisynthesis n=1 Tax=Actinacidiphila yanglinensis TaxID=310779 RepID=A0A1H6BED5_9ACTN|nr:glycosyltransferase family 4 protein [Actinacidiphila yanglinensis]SEG58685.1 Glycosyltransferase involved in cell wall bisynthesis [Actinacidiphila yanglinensis]